MKRLLIYMAFVWGLSGCSPEGTPLLPSSNAIRFVSGVSVGGTKSGGPVSGTMLPADSRIGLCAVSEQTREGENGKLVVMNNLPGTIGVEGTIDYDPVKYYETGRKYTFYACYPYTSVLNYTDATQTPSISVSLAPHADAQEDYMWAALPEVTGASSGTQKLTFRHALCRVRIRLWNGSMGEASLDGISLSAPGSGTLSLSDGSWTEVHETQNKGFSTFTLFHPAEPVELPKDAFYEVPASLLQLPVGEEAMKLQTFSLQIAGKTYDIHPSTPAAGWQPGLSYLYTVWYATEGITFKGTVEDWNTVQGGDIETEE